MGENRPTPVQQHYKDVLTLRHAGVPLTPQDLAEATGGSVEDFKGMYMVRANPELRELMQKRQERLIRMAGMSSPSEGPFGAELILQDIQKGVSWLVGLFQRPGMKENKENTQVSYTPIDPESGRSQED